MLPSSQLSDLISSKNNKENKLTYISTYNMGKIGIKKIIEEPIKTQVNTDNKILIQSYPINNNITNITNNTNNNTNNTNTNTNSNTNNNTSKNKDKQTSKKKIKNKHNISPNIIYTHTQSSSNSKYHYKNK